MTAMRRCAALLAIRRRAMRCHAIGAAGYADARSLRAAVTRTRLPLRCR